MAWVYRSMTSKADRKRSDSKKGKASKGEAKKNTYSGKVKRKGGDKPAKKKIPARIAKVMSQYKNARVSDVSDKVFVATSPVHGKGLFAAKKIKADTVLGRLHGMPTFDDGIYVLWISDELGLELTNDFRFINHDSEPNAAYSDLDVTVLRDVEAGEELLHDYGW